MTLARVHDTMPAELGLSLCHALAQSGQHEARNQLVQMLAVFCPDSPAVARLEFNVALFHGDHRLARQVLDQKLRRFDSETGARLAEIELLAHERDLTAACGLLRPLLNQPDCGLPTYRLAVRLLSECGEHRQVVDLSIRFLEAENLPEMFAIATRSARIVNAMDELFAALQKLKAPLNGGQLMAWEAAIEDLYLADSAPVISLPSLGAHVPHRQARIMSLAGANTIERMAINRGQSIALLFCVDSAYLIPGFVAVLSAAMSNRLVELRMPVVIMCDGEDALTACAKLSEILSSKIGLAIECLAASNIVRQSHLLDPAYGFFSSGNRLSPAAYHRMFLARHLRKEKRFERVVYMDSDVVVRPGLLNIFDIPSSKPLLARTDIERPEVVSAKRMLGLTGKYFNSGIMRMDLAHRDFGRAIEHAIAYALDPAAPKNFHDQCALNKGFDGLYDPLPQLYNCYCSPQGADSPPRQGDAVVVHYLDRPKPWDSLYRKDASEWFMWHDVLRSISGGITGSR